MNNFQDKANFIWQVADDILRGTFKQHEYGDVILPFVVLRRLDCVLEDHKDDVIKTFNNFKDKLPDPTQVLLKAAKGVNFYNTSFFDLKRLSQDAGNIELNFNDYINGYSKNVREIIENFQIDTYAVDLTEDDKIDVKRSIVTKHGENEELKLVVKGNNTLENIRYKSDQIVDDLLLDFVNTKLDLYKKLTDDIPNSILKQKLFEGVIASGSVI